MRKLSIREMKKLIQGLVTKWWIKDSNPVRSLGLSCLPGLLSVGLSTGEKDYEHQGREDSFSESRIGIISLFFILDSSHSNLPREKASSKS